MGAVVSVVVSAAATLGLIWLTRGVTAEGPNSDSRKQMAAALRVGWGRWPSCMHVGPLLAKTRMRDAWVVLLAVMQRWLRDRQTFHPVVAASALGHGLSALFLYGVATHAWGSAVGALLMVSYLGCLWPYQIVLAGMPHALAQAACLGTVWWCQQAAGMTGAAAGLAYGAAGITGGLMMFTSSTARKYLPLCAAAFLVSQRAVLAPLWTLQAVPPGGWAPWLVGWGLAAALIVAGMRGLVGVVSPRLVPKSSYPGVVILLYGTVALALSRAGTFWLAQLAFWVGAGAVFLFFLLPHLVENLRAFLGYWVSQRDLDHFRLYRQHFAQRGGPIPTRSPAGPWLARFAWRVLPWHVVTVALVAAGVAVRIAQGGGSLADGLAALGLVGLSAAPALVGIVTRNQFMGRSYFPALLGLLLFVGWGVARATASADGVVAWLWPAVIVTTAAGALWTGWALVTDLWPTRMATARLAQALQRLGVRRFATYRTAYNHALVDVVVVERPGQFDVRYVPSLWEVQERYVVVPGTSAKALNMESEGEAIDGGDFTGDPAVTALLASRAITRYAVASLPTVGSSRFWMTESEVASYREFMLHEITSEDRWRGRAWVLDAARWRADQGGRGGPAAAEAPDQRGAPPLAEAVT